ncbi:hypothetical protein M514_28246 [Trichuris suis]|uniref:Uncharacterized protein n=1 Tax=Trichuris suis TaxID=68888 RepID=A0A085MQT0_9BILA|nr:hypothetical protein M514_28246 [Trichuris suis]
MRAGSRAGRNATAEQSYRNGVQLIKDRGSAERKIVPAYQSSKVPQRLPHKFKGLHVKEHFARAYPQRADTVAFT